MRFITAKEFRADRAWGSLPVASMNGVTTKLHWTDEPYRWHTNDGDEVFVVLDGVVEMHYREGGREKVRQMTVGDIFYADAGTEHVAHPLGEARVLVVELEGSV
ncbi:MAG TPA: cupin domain-containing protein [Pyrinomonadaceae bacterium]|nr:cupin domain-containing protein [Pyrinomonadaceae bacterium]